MKLISIHLLIAIFTSSRIFSRSPLAILNNGIGDHKSVIFRILLNYVIFRWKVEDIIFLYSLCKFMLPFINLFHSDNFDLEWQLELP